MGKRGFWCAGVAGGDFAISMLHCEICSTRGWGSGTLAAFALPDRAEIVAGTAGLVEFEEAMDPTGSAGYCLPYADDGGDLCRDASTRDSAACDGADSSYYLPSSCDEECGRSRCSTDAACVGYTIKQDGLVKLKGTAAEEATGFRCFRKQANSDRRLAEEVTSECTVDPTPAAHNGRAQWN